jgi:hypothetical protein
LHYSIQKCFTKFVLLATSQDLPEKKWNPLQEWKNLVRKGYKCWHGIEEPTSRMNPKPRTLFLDDSKLLLFRNITSKIHLELFGKSSPVLARWGFFLCQGLFFRDYGGLGLVHFIKWMTHQGKPEF